MRPRVILFDIDNTLMTSGGAGRRALLRAVAEETGVDCSLARVAFAGRTDPAILRDLLGAIGVEPSAAAIEAIFERYLRHLASELSTNGAAAVLPGVLDAIEALSRAPGAHMGLLTGNIARGAAIKLEAGGLAGRFAFGAYGDDAPRRPDLLPVALARWRAACGAKACAMQDVYVVGDTVEDVAVARAHGARAVAVGTGRPFQDREALLAARPDFFFEDLREARPFLEEVRIGG
jgi:phosphoglycolate phosphatase-like HAD superfamily hydrolase